MQKYLRIAILTLLGSPLLAAHTNAQNLRPIDDFETGEFFIQTNFDYIEETVSVPGHFAHAIAMERTFKLSPAAMMSGENEFVTRGGTTDGYLDIKVADGGAVQVVYEWGTPKDLTVNGTVDEFQMLIQMQGFGASGFVTATISNGVNQAGKVRQIPTYNLETLTWSLSEWSSAIVENATRMEFHFPPNQQGSFYQVYDIRFFSLDSSPITMSGTTTNTETPPVPTAPLLFDILDDPGPLYTASVTIANAETDAPNVPVTIWAWNEASGLPGDWADIMTVWKEPGAPVATNFEIQIEALQANGLVPDLYPPDPIHGPESILLSFPVALRDGPGGPYVASTDTWLTIDIGSGQALELTNVSVTPGTARSSAGGFTLSFRMQPAPQGTPDAGQPVLRTRWVSDMNADIPVAVGPAGAPAVGDGLVLAPRPVVARAGTTIHVNRPLASDAWLRVLDVSGRLVRSIDAGAGTRSVRWDGRGGNGERVAPGAYFLRLQDARGTATSRVVVLR